MGRDPLPGYTLSQPGALGLVAMTFRTTAVAPAGSPGTVRVRVCPALSLAVGAPSPMRVSRTVWAGVMAVKPNLMGVMVGLGADPDEVPTALAAVTVKE